MWRELITLWRGENLLEQAWKESFEMLRIDHEMFLEAVKVLRERDDAEVSEDILKKDEVVDAYEQDVRRKVLTHCAMQGAPEIPAGMVLVTIVVDVERIGDYIKNVVNLANTYAPRLVGGKFEEALQQIEEAVKESFVGTRACIESSDADAATELLKEYGRVKKLCDDCLEGLIHEEDKSLSSGQAVALSLYVRWLRRINSHLHNLNTSVVNPFDRIGFKSAEG